MFCRFVVLKCSRKPLSPIYNDLLKINRKPLHWNNIKCQCIIISSLLKGKRLEIEERLRIKSYVDDKIIQELDFVRLSTRAI